MKSLIYALFVVPPLLLFHFQPIPGFPMEFMAFFFLVLSFLILVIFYGDKVAFPKLGVLWVIIGLVWVAVGIDHKPNFPVNSHWVFVFWLVGFLSLIVSASVVNIFGRKNVILIFSTSIVSMASVQCFIGFLNHYGLMGEFFSWMNYRTGRFSGTVAQPNAAAFSIFLGFISLFYLFFVGRISAVSTYLLSYVLIYFSFITYSRSFYIYITVFLILLVFAFFRLRLYLKPRFSLSIFFAFFIIPFLATFSAKYIDDGFRQMFSGFGIENLSSDSSERINDFSGSGRLCEWSKTYDHLYNDTFPLLGFGHGSYSGFSADNTTELTLGCSKNLLWNHSHNLFVNALVEWGWIGLAAIILSILILFISALYRPENGRKYYYICGLGVFIIYSMLEFPLWNVYFLIVFSFMVSMNSIFWKVEFSSHIVTKLIGGTFALVLGFGAINAFYVYLNVSSIFNSSSVGEKELRWLYLYGSDSLWGDRVILTRYYKFLPEPYQFDQQLLEVNALLDVQRHPLAIIRKGVLYYLIGDEGQFCSVANVLENQYPKYFFQLKKDLNVVIGSPDFNASRVFSCW